MFLKLYLEHYLSEVLSQNAKHNEVALQLIIRLCLIAGFIWLLNSAVQSQGGWAQIMGIETGQISKPDDDQQYRDPWANQPSNEHQRRQRARQASGIVESLDIYDDNFKACVYTRIVYLLSQSKLVTSENLSALTSLTCDNRSIRDLTGIERLSHLQNLRLRSNQLTSLGALQYHPGIERLDLYGNDRLRSFDVLLSIPNLLQVNYPRDTKMSCAKYQEYNRRAEAKRRSLQASLPGRCHNNRYGYDS